MKKKYRRKKERKKERKTRDKGERTKNYPQTKKERK